MKKYTSPVIPLVKSILHGLRLLLVQFDNVREGIKLKETIAECDSTVLPIVSWVWIGECFHAVSFAARIRRRPSRAIAIIWFGIAAFVIGVRTTLTRLAVAATNLQTVSICSLRLKIR